VQQPFGYDRIRHKIIGKSGIGALRGGDQQREFGLAKAGPVKA